MASLDGLKEDIKTLEQKYAAVLEENNKLLDTQEGLNGELEEMSSMYEELKNDQASMKSNKTPDSANEDSDKNKASELELKHKLDKVEANFMDTSSKLADAENVNQEQKMRIKDAANKLELACKEREALEKALDQSQLDNEKAKDDICKLSFEVRALILKRDATGNKRKELSNELAPFEQRLKQLISTQKHLEAERNQSNEQLLAERKRWREIMYNMNIVLQIVGVIFFLVIYVFCRFWYMQ